MTKDDVVTHLTQMIVDDAKFQRYLYEQSRKELAIRDIQVPEDPSDYEPFWELVSATGIEIMLEVMIKLRPHRTWVDSPEPVTD